MVENNTSAQLQERYLKSGWLESFGHGVYKRFGDTPTWLGGVHSLQEQAGYIVHVEGLTALSLRGREHY